MASSGSDIGRYPLFIPPDELARQTPAEWSSAQARRYLTWMQSVMDRRIHFCLTYLGVDGKGPPAQLLASSGERAAWALRKPEFSAAADGGVTLTNAGHALAADLGLLLAKGLIDEGAGRIQWKVLDRPRTAASFNHPVLVGFGKLHLDPIRGSIAEAYGVLKGLRGGHAWADAFRHWVSKVADH